MEEKKNDQCNFRIEKLIGKGSYGSVYKVKNLCNDRYYALKKLNLCTNQYEKVSIINELRILAYHKSPFLIRLKVAYIQDYCMCIVTEYASKGDLAGIIRIRQEQQNFFLEHEIWHYLLQVSIALDYLHKLNIIHRDIKPANIFVDEHNNVKLGDFGIVKIMKSYMMCGQTQIGTPLYMCPEIHKRERYDIKADIWALGCILYELMTLSPAFHAKNMIELKHKIYARNLPVLQLKYSSNLKSILDILLAIKPRLRPSMTALLNLPGIKDQLKIHKLEKDLNHDNKNRDLFKDNFFLPRNISDWKQIVRNVIDNLDLTVVHDDDSERIQRIANANKEIDNMNRRNTEKIKEIHANMNKIKSEIEGARKFILHKELEMATYQDELNNLQTIFNKFNKYKPQKSFLRPIPPPKPPVYKPSPKSNILKNI